MFVWTYSWVDLQTSESEASEILKAASQSGRLDKTDGSHAIIAGIKSVRILKFTCVICPFIIHEMLSSLEFWMKHIS